VNQPTPELDELVELTLTIGLPEHDLVILAEGNTSAQTREGHFAVKASGAQMALATADDFVELEWDPLVRALDDESVGNAEVTELFRRASPGDGPRRRPSTETFIHAVGYGLCGATHVAHTHPTAITAMLSSTFSDADLRCVLFPDEAVVGGVEPALVGYADPGIELGRLVYREVIRYQQALGRDPRVVLLKNHGMVAFGRSAQEVKAASFMATKAARVRLAAAAAGGLSPLPEGAAEHLAGRTDEQARLTNIFGEERGRER
jgi:rhamnose utilization protein RhaD (predicted bifunctional aldolase and dehydrogenase)